MPTMLLPANTLGAGGCARLPLPVEPPLPAHVLSAGCNPDQAAASQQQPRGPRPLAALHSTPHVGQPAAHLRPIVQLHYESTRAPGASATTPAATPATQLNQEGLQLQVDGRPAYPCEYEGLTQRDQVWGMARGMACACLQGRSALPQPGAARPARRALLCPRFSSLPHRLQREQETRTNSQPYTTALEHPCARGRCSPSHPIRPGPHPAHLLRQQEGAGEEVVVAGEGGGHASQVARQGLFARNLQHCIVARRQAVRI